MDRPIYHIHAFAEGSFNGNPAAVCPMDEWPDKAWMQSIAKQNNLSETAFFVKKEDGFHIRWFTPAAEVDLCGHATLASAYVIFNILGSPDRQILFHSRSGKLVAMQDHELICMNFPAQPPIPCRAPDALIHGLKQAPQEVWGAEDYMAVYSSEREIEYLDPDLERFKGLDRRGVIVTAPGTRADFVSRFFAPKYGIPEDPVTGSAHCALTPYWAAKLGKEKMIAHQISKQGGKLYCTHKDDRVIIAGKAVPFTPKSIL